jgi:hypothetical protein
MIRLIGILTGSAIAVTGMFFAFGAPELTSGLAEAPVTTQLTEALPPDVEQTLIEDSSFEMQPRAESIQPVEVIHETDVATDADGHTEPEAPFDKIEEVAMTPAPVPETASQTPKWYAFWSPFRSELAADGFISELQRTTGLDYRVVKLKPGVYEVAFAYTDPIDRQDKLEQISAATGLDMSGG